MIHTPQSVEGIIGRAEVMGKLYTAWKYLTTLLNDTLNIFKEDWGMDRHREALIDRAKEPLLNSRTFIEQVIELFKEDLRSIIHE
ncbi:MAG: hypothetical protein ACFFG0_34235 [Candidatus Thorarchaeota archaeon]